MMLHLPNVTLVCVETKVHELAHFALKAAMARAKFGEVLIYTNRPELIRAPGARYFVVPDWADKIKMGTFYYTEAAQAIRTSHALLMEWDAGINDVSMWSDDFLNYDYIGAPWDEPGGKPVSPTNQNVGNGGFALMSKRLSDFIYASRGSLPMQTDGHIATIHRAVIEAAGFTYPTEATASDFSFEGWTMRGPSMPAARPSSFGWHGVFNWHLFLDQQDALERVDMLLTNPYAADSKMEWLVKTAPPWLKAHISTATRKVRRRPLAPSRISRDHMSTQARVAWERDMQKRGLKA